MTLCLKPLGTDKGSQDNQNVIVLPKHLFAWAIKEGSLTHRIQIYQEHQKGLIKDWAKANTLQRMEGLWTKDS